MSFFFFSWWEGPRPPHYLPTSQVHVPCFSQIESNRLTYLKLVGLGFVIIFPAAWKLFEISAPPPPPPHPDEVSSSIAEVMSIPHGAWLVVEQHAAPLLGKRTFVRLIENSQNGALGRLSSAQVTGGISCAVQPVALGSASGPGQVSGAADS